MYEPAPHGRIEVISGCMFAGKTEELLRRLRRARIAGLSIETITPAIDDRYGTEIIGTHNNDTCEATVIDPETDLDALYRNARDADVIGIDEGNFFESNLIPVLNNLADEGHRVIVCGTDQTFRGEPFEPMNNLLSVADDVTKLAAVCTCCGKQATRNQRLIDGEPAPVDSPTILVGGDESYEARCRQCHNLPS